MTGRWLLLPAALAAWAGALLGTIRSAGTFGSAGSAWLPGLIVAATGVVVAAVGIRRWLGRPDARAVGLSSAGAGLVLVGVSASLHVAAVHAAPWPELVERRALVTVRAQVVTDPRPIAAPAGWDGATGDQHAQVRVLALEDAGPQAAQGSAANGSAARALETRWQLRSLARLRAPLGAGGSTWTRGDIVQGRVRVAPPQRGGTGGAESALLTATEALQVQSAAHGPVVEIPRRLREAMAPAGADRAELVVGMVFGDDSRLPAQVRDAMLVSGLSHLTAVSGSNIAIVTGLVLLIGRLMGLRSRWAVVPAVVVLVAYVAVVGLQPSVVRATAMALVMLAGLLLGGGAGMTALLLSIVALLVADPWLAGSRGFALSCAATAGLLVAADPARRWVVDCSARLPPWARGPWQLLLAATLTAAAAGIATAPLLAAYGQGLSFVSVVANVAAAPMVPVVTVSGLLVAGLAWLPPPASAVVGPVAEVPSLGAGWIIRVAAFCANIPGGRIPWPSGWWWAAALAGILLGVLALGRRWRWLPFALPAVAGTVSIVAASAPSAMATMPADWRLVFCDVGQGDATLLRTGPASAVLVDTGPDPPAALDCLHRSGVQQVDAVILSHFHRDHVAGLAAVLEGFHPHMVLVSPLDEPADTYADAQAVLRRTSTPSAVPAVGQSYRVGGASWVVLGPAGPLREGSAPNNTSVTVVADVVGVDADATADADADRPVRVLLPGDLEPEGQARLMSSARSQDVDVVKVPHHGSSQQDRRLPGWAHAEMAVISCGADNTYGHPAAPTVAAWRAAGAAVERTDVVGDVIVAGAEPMRVFTRAATSRPHRAPGAPALPRARGH